MNRSILLLVIVLILSLAAACGPAALIGGATPVDDAAQSEPEALPQEPDATLPELEADQLEEIAMKRVGGEGYGFFDIPENWVNFFDPQTAGEDNVIQFSDILGQNIITVRYMPATPDLATPEEMLGAVAEYMASMGGDGITGARVDLNGIDALQVYGFFQYDGTSMVVWGFASDGGTLHQIVAEGPIEGAIGTILDTVNYLESSFALES